MAVICNDCGETRGLFHKCAQKDVNAEQMEAASRVMQQPPQEAKEFMPSEAVISAQKQERKPDMVKRAQVAKKEYARKMEIEAVKQMVDAPDNHEAVQDSEIKQIVETMQMMSEKMSEYEARIVQLEAFNAAAESAWVEMAEAIGKLESFAAGIRFERGAQPAKMDDLG